MQGLSPVESLTLASGVSMQLRDTKNSRGPGLAWSQEVLDLQPGESSQQLVLKKIRELSDSDLREPFIVANLDILASRHRLFCDSLPWVTPFYAVKCNSSPWVLRVLNALGTGFDCASQVEMEQVLSLGVAPSRIIYANPCKPVPYIQFAARNGVQLLTFDSEEELTKVTQHHPEARLVIRLWTQDSDSSFPLSTKFGARVEVCEHLLKSARDLGLVVVGVSFHVGSDCHTPHSFIQAIEDCRRVFEMAREVGHDLNLLDIGGGFPGVEGSESRFEETARVINACLARNFPEESGIKVIAEPGRFYAESVSTVAVNIIAKKSVLEPGGCRKLMYYLNEGHYGLFRLCLRQPFSRTPTVVKELCSDAPLLPCTLFGPTCDAYDRLFVEEVRLPELDVGDWLVFSSMGAYTSVMSSTFNGFPLTSIFYAAGPELRSLLGLESGVGSCPEWRGCRAGFATETVSDPPSLQTVLPDHGTGQNNLDDPSQLTQDPKNLPAPQR